MIRREYSTFALIIALHAGMEVIENYWLDERLTFGQYWGSALAVAVAMYLVVAVLKKHTRLLTVAGR